MIQPVDLVSVDSVLVDPVLVDPRRARIRVRAGAVVVLLLVGLGCAVLVSVLNNPGSTTAVARQEPEASARPEGAVGLEIFVHVLGAVEHPGLYGLLEGDRAVDAVAAAGGYTEIADRAHLNLARFVVDGEQIRIPVLGEVPAAAPGMTANGLVNLNSADAAALETLPRVGPALAARIIDWREANGGFTAIEDLLNVSGIGTKTFDGLKDLVSV